MYMVEYIYLYTQLPYVHEHYEMYIYLSPCIYLDIVEHYLHSNKMRIYIKM